MKDLHLKNKPNLHEWIPTKVHNYQIKIKSKGNADSIAQKYIRNETVFKNFKYKNILMEQDKLLNKLVQKQTSNEFLFESTSTIKNTRIFN